MPVFQIRNPELVTLLSADLQARYEPQFAWVNALSAFSMLPGLRGFWPMSSCDQAGAAYDFSGQARTLTYNGNPTYSAAGLAPYIALDGVGDYLSRADEAGLDIVGTETVMAAALRGLTLGGWFYRNNLATDMGLIGKYLQVGDQRSYLLRGGVAGTVIFYANSTGAAAGDVLVISSNTVTAGAWQFAVGRFDPSTEIAVFVNGTKTTLAAGIPAGLFSGTAEFNIGAFNNGATELLAGRAALCFLCAAALPDAIIGQLYEQSRAMLGI